MTGSRLYKRRNPYGGVLVEAEASSFFLVVWISTDFTLFPTKLILGVNMWKYNDRSTYAI
jgi:hypothetical protein